MVAFDSVKGGFFATLPATNIYLEVRAGCCQDNFVAMEDLSTHLQFDVSEHLVALHEKHHLQTTSLTSDSTYLPSPALPYN